MHRLIAYEWEMLVKKLFASEMTNSERALALMELATQAEILAGDIRRNARQRERGLA